MRFRQISFQVFGGEGDFDAVGGFFDGGLGGVVGDHGLSVEYGGVVGLGIPLELEFFEVIEEGIVDVKVLGALEVRKKGRGIHLILLSNISRFHLNKYDSTFITINKTYENSTFYTKNPYIKLYKINKMSRLDDKPTSHIYQEKSELHKPSQMKNSIRLHYINQNLD